MTSDRDIADSPEKAAPEEPSGTPRRKTIQFVVLFVVYVLGLLIGYRYAVNTEANMWYLFTTAKHTAALLNILGDHAEVQPGQQGSWSRQQLDDWRSGGEAHAATDDQATAQEAPLTPYERWLYTAYQNLALGGTLDEAGPTVDFVAAPGLVTKIQTANDQLRAIRRDPNRTEAQEAAAVAKYTALTEERDALPAGDERNYALRDRQFRFILVPDCGAIEVMSIFVAAVCAFPTLWRKRLLGLFIGLPVLYGVNLIRLSSLAFLASYDPTQGLKWFHFGHEYVWQAVFIIFVVAVWLCWIEFMVQRARA